MFAVIYSRVMRCRSSDSRRLRCSFESSASALGRLDLFLTSGVVALASRVEGRMQPPSSSPERSFPLHHCHSGYMVGTLTWWLWRDLIGAVLVMVAQLVRVSDKRWVLSHLLKSHLHSREVERSRTHFTCTAHLFFVDI